MWKRLEQIGRQPSGSAACIENSFISAQLETRENFLAPADLWLGKPVILG
jgi:hypothetical protein